MNEIILSGFDQNWGDEVEFQESLVKTRLHLMTFEQLHLKKEDKIAQIHSSMRLALRQRLPNHG